MISASNQNSKCNNKNTIDTQNEHCLNKYELFVENYKCKICNLLFKSKNGNYFNFLYNNITWLKLLNKKLAFYSICISSIDT